MNTELKNLLKKIKQELCDDPSSIIYAEIEDVLSEDVDISLYTKLYRDFLQECNGARFGAIDIWGKDDFLQNQYRVMNIAGGNEEWICIGQVLYEPLVINKKDELVYLFYQGQESEITPLCFGSLDDFLLQYALGEKYSEIIPETEDDDWYIFLTEHDFFDVT